METNLPTQSATATWDPDPTRITKLTVKVGETIFKQGDEGDAAYLVESGEVLLYQMQGIHRIELSRLKQGEMFGEMAVIDHNARMATAVATTEVKLSRIPCAMFQKKLEASDRFVRGLLRMLIGNLRTTQTNFQRRPRSFRDKVLVLEEVADYIESFANAQTGENAQILTEKLGVLRTLVTDLRDLTGKLPDSHSNAILEAGETLPKG